jgi:hypothetical protein
VGGGAGGDDPKRNCNGNPQLGPNLNSIPEHWGEQSSRHLEDIQTDNDDISRRARSRCLSSKKIFGFLEFRSGLGGYTLEENY